MSGVLRLKPEEKQKPGLDRSVEARWGKELVEEGFCPISSYFLRNYHRLLVCPGKRARPMNSSEAMAVVQLFDYKWDNRDPWPAVGKIAKCLGISVRSTREILRTLDNAKLVERKFSRSGGTSRYSFDGLISKLEYLRRNDAKNQVDKEFKEAEEAEETNKKAIPGKGGR